MPNNLQAIASLRKVVTVDWRDKSAAQQKALLIATARRGHVRIMREATARSGVVPYYQAYANTPGNSNIETVKIPGPIVYEYYYTSEIVKETIKMLRDRSPVESGKYRDSHGLWIDGLPAEPDARLLPHHEIFVSNPVDYARRIEVGKTTSGRTFTIKSSQAHVYEKVSKKIKAKYGDMALIEFGYVELPGAWIIKGGLPPHYLLPTGKKRKRRQNVGEAVRAPAIFITPYER